MAITADEIRKYPLSIEKKGYHMEEVDQLLDRVAEEIDDLNATIANLRFQLENRPEPEPVPVAAPAVETEPVVDETAHLQAMAELRAAFEQQINTERANAAAAANQAAAKITELETALADAKADGNAIAQALIIAQRSADEILSNANAQAVQIIDDAKEDASAILARAEEDKQAVEDEIDGLLNDREDARASYQDLLRNFITDATSKLASISEKDGAHAKPVVAAAPAAASAPVLDPGTTGRVSTRAQIPARQISADTYVTPQTAAVPVAATPTPSKVTKDLSGFGDADSDFLFGDVD